MSKPTILVVEDEQPLRQMLHEVLSLEGYLVELAINGQEAIDILKKDDTIRRIMLLDLVMPIVDGWGVVRWIVEHPEVKANTRIVLMSANERLKLASDLEHDAELAKPFGIDRMIEIITPYVQN
jgi:CheY-like chemotaxis protein